MSDGSDKILLLLLLGLLLGGSLLRHLLITSTHHAEERALHGLELALLVLLDQAVMSVEMKKSVTYRRNSSLCSL